jgi:filamentous hemagglutinin family protein
LARLHGLRAGVSTLLLAALTLGTPATIQAGDILRGGASAKNADRNAQGRAQAGAEAAQAAKVRAQDRLSRNTKAVNDMRALQASARAAAGANSIPNGLTRGGLERLAGHIPIGANEPTASGNTVNIKQTAAQALLHWKTFNVSRDTTVNFDQSAGGSDAGKWIAFNKVFDPAAKPSQIRGKINAQGQVYIINQNGIVFGAGSQINTRALVASTLPINDNLVANGLLNNKDAQFLFSALEVPGGSDGTPTFTPTDVPAVLGDVVVERGAKISSPELAGGNGGRVMLVGANVRNEGEINTPAGQTILAAGMQVGVQAHNSSDPSLRGLDAWVGSVGNYAGTVTNSGLIEAKTGSILAVGKQINQSGVLESTTSVNLNGRIDLLASYGAVANPDFDKDGAGGPIFLNQFTGTVQFSPASLTRILPDYESTKAVPGTKLSQNSKINIDAQSIQFAGGATMLAPSGEVRMRAGLWAYKDDESNNRTIFDAEGVAESGLDSNFAGGGQRFYFKEGSVNMASGSILDVAGTPDVFVPMDQYIQDIQLRGTELADSPLQRSQKLRGKTLTIDLRRSGTYGGRFWIGTPLGDATGLANIIERNVAQLTTRGGTVEITAGTAVNLAAGSEINVSGGYTRNEGGLVKTSRLIRGSQILDISEATPDVVYDGLFDDSTTVTSPKWGITKVYRKALSPSARFKEPTYIEGAAGGSLNLTAPSVQLAGNVIGNTVTGPKQLNTPPGHSALSLSFKNQNRLEVSASDIFYVNSIPAAPAIVFSNTNSATGLPLAGRELSGTLAIAPKIFEEDGGGFGFLTIDNTDGTILVPKDSPLKMPAGGSLALKATNVEILSSVTIPGGSLSVTTYNYSPFTFEEKQALQLLANQPAPAVVEGHGIIRVGPAVSLNTSGTNYDERRSSMLASHTRRALDGGTAALEGFSIFMDSSSMIDASGGYGATARGKFSKGNGGTISILAGRDPLLSTSAGGSLQLPGTLQAYSALKGGTLRIQAPEISIFGNIGDSPVLSQGSRLSLSPAFFQRGGFTDYSLIGSGLENSSNPTAEVRAGTTINPLAETLVYSKSKNQGGQIALEPRLLPLGERNPASLSLEARGFDDIYTQDKIESIGSLVISSGTTIETDPLGKVNLRGQTVEIFGTINAPAGKITIQADSKYPLSPDASITNSSALTTLYVATSARLLAQGTTVLTHDPYGRRAGVVLAGGTISLKGNIVAEQGAFFDVSGTTNKLDIHPSRLGGTIRPSASTGLASKPWGQQSIRVQVDSNGGAIALQGSQMLLSDATLRGFAGGPSAIGGLLSVSSGAFLIESGADTNLIVSQSGKVIDPTNTTLGVGLPVLGPDGNPLTGSGFFTANTFTTGGFDSLDLGFEYFASASVPYGGNIEFKGPVAITAPGAIRLAGGGVITADDHVALNGSYVAIGQEFRPPLHPNDTFIPFKNQENEAISVAPTSGSGSLSINARLVDVGTTVLKNISNLSITASNGDIRGSGYLNVAGSINLTAGQIYPTTLAKFQIFAYGEEGSVQINQSGTRNLPMSAGGNLGLYAKSIINAGTLRAPFGSITLGWDGLDSNPATEDLDTPGNPVAGTENFPVTESLTLRAGSTTSVSTIDPRTGEGILVPFGLSPDGNSWIDPRGVNVTTAGMPEKKIRLAADSILQETGSSIDLRGGGDLLAFRWISGPGGSADILGSPTPFSPSADYSAAKLVSYNGKTYSSRMALDPSDFNGAVPTPGKTAYWLEIPDSYAILPGFGSEFAPYNPFNSNSNAGAFGGDAGFVSSLKLGDQIVFDGNAALPAGTYTLLPRRYGVMPGAYLVTPLSGAINPFTNAEGATFASAYRTNSLSPTASAPALRANFEILTPAVLAERSEYETYRANTFIPQAAAALRTVVSQPLPRDSAALAIQGNNALALQGNVLARSLNGLGANIDISSQSAITIGSSSTVADGVVLDAARLSSWGASSLLIGGLRQSTTTGTVVDVNSDSITLSGSLSGSDLILASKTSLTLQEGSSLSSTGLPTIASSKISIAGQGALVRVSSDANAAFARTSTAGDNEPSLIVEDGATISGAGVILDSTKAVSISPTASLTAQSLALGSQKIVVDFAGSSTDSSALILGGSLLSNLSSVQRLSLNSYSSIDFNGSGRLGSGILKSLSLLTGGLQGLGGDITLEASSVSFANPLASTFEAADADATLEILAQTLDLGSGVFELGGFDSSSITASAGVTATGTGTLKSEGSITIAAPAVTASRLTTYDILSSADLTLNDLPTASTVSSELGATLSLTGASVAINSDIVLPSGLLKIQATNGDVTIGSKLSVDGSAHTFYDTTRYADAGSIVIKSDVGNVALNSGGILSVSAATGGGRAGLLQISAPEGDFQNAGTLLGKAASGYEGGSFQLDVEALSDFAAINAQLEDGGFDTSRIFRVRTGDVVLDQAIKSHTFELAADGGNIEVSNTIDASGETGGRIALSASGSLTLLDGANLSVVAEKFNSAGKGGEIFLAAGSQLNGAVDSEATLNLSAGELNLAVESYEPGNYDQVGSSAFQGKFQGILRLRAPRNDDLIIQISAIASDINSASAIFAEGYKLYDLTEDPASSIDITVDTDVILANGEVISRTLEAGKMNTLLRDQIHADNQAFLGTEDDGFGNEGTLLTALLDGNPDADTLASLLVVAPGVEIINRTGDLTLGLANTPTGLDEADIEATSAADWDLSSWRYGTKQAPGILALRASGDIIFNNSLSDGFASLATDDPTVFTNGLTYDANGHSTLWLAQLQNINPDLPTNIQSWSYTITAGADLSGASQDSLLTISGLAEDKGSILVGEFYPAKSNPSDGSDDQSIAGTGQLGTTANNLRINLTEIDETTYVLDEEGNPVLDEDGNSIIENEGTGLLKDLGTRYEVVRTGTGDIRVHAARDVQLRNQFATIYTAGVAVPESTRIFSDGDFVVPIVNFDPALHPEQPSIGAPSQIFTPQWAMAGGNLKIRAGNDIARVTQFTDLDGNVSTVFDSSHQITSNWLYRRGHVDSTTGKIAAINFNDATGTPQEDIAASTTWWIDYSNFFQGFGALGGGNVDLVAGKDVVNADAVAPTNARMAGRAEGENLAPSADNLLEFGGGDVSIVAGRNIDGGLYYVERGQGLIQAGAAVKTNASRSPSLGLLNRVDETDFSDPTYFPESTWLPTALFLGKGDFEVSAKSDILLGPLANAFLMPAGLGNKFWYKTYFSTFSPETSVNVSSLGGSVTFRGSTVLPSDTEGTTRNILSAWMEQQNLFTVDNQGIASSNFQPWARLTETNLETFRSVLDLAPPILKTTAFTGGVNVVGNLLLAPSANGNMELLAAGAMKGLQVAGTTDVYSSAWIYSTLNVSDANPALIPSALAPLSYYGFAGESGLSETSPSLLNSLNQALAESGSYAGNDAAIDLKIKRHGTSLLHAGDTNPVKIYAAGGDFTGFNVFTPKATRLVAGGDITDVALYIQNLNKSDISIVAAGGDILPYNESSALRSLATDTAAGNKIFDPERNTAGGKLVTALAGDIQVSGPGLLEVLAGRNLDLGTGENLFDGTGVGITSIGNARNPNLPFEGASLIALAGIQGKNGGAALGLANSRVALSNLKAVAPKVTTIKPQFSTAEHEAVAGLQTLFAILQATGKDFPETGSYEPGLSAVKQAFASITGTGDIFTRARDIRTVSGGSIALTAPKGALTMASDIYGNPLTPPGIVTEYGGSVSIITDGDVDIGRARIFTLRGGDMTIWSTTGDIAAGTSPKTVVTAPPTRVLIDSPSADVATDLGGLATGGGIGVLASVEGVEPGDVYLLAPAGSVDAGDAGIQSTGNLNIAAVAVVNADNIAAAGTSAGVPASAPASAAPVSVAPSASTSSAATSSAAQNMASQTQSNKDVEESPSMISVEILGYGGGDGDNGDEEEKSASL